MKKIFCAVLFSAIGLTTYAQTAKKPVAKSAPTKPAIKKTVIKPKTPVAPTVFTLKNDVDSASYAFASSIGNGLKSSGLTSLNYDVFLKGLKDAFTGGTLILDQAKAQEAINNALAKASRDKFKTNVDEGENFLRENKKRAGVMTTASGLQYEMVNAGTSTEKPTAASTVTVHYKGTLINGKQFDSSYDRNEPTTFPLAQVIQGWQESLQLMTVGSKYKFYIPYQLAYGERGAGANIPPYSALIFEIELIKIGD